MEDNKAGEENASTPGALALTVAQLSDEIVFKKPFPVSTPKKVFKAEVLEEDTYLEEIGKIIQRDFFPDLEKLKAQNDYLNAIEHNDFDKLREIYNRYGIGRRLSSDFCSSPATFETPVMRKIESTENPNQAKQSDVIDVDEPPSKLRKPKTLDQFLKCYTSEDNESFEDIIIENEKKQRAKFPWLYKDENAITGGVLALPSTEEQLQIQDRPANIETWAYKNRNYVMYVPDGVQLTQAEQLEMSKKKKEINFTGTRFHECPFNEEQNKETIQTLAQSQSRVLDGKIGIDGKELSLDAPEMNGYGFVKTPSPMPGVNESPLMTWGEIDGTPFRLDGSDTPVRPGLPGPVFKIAEPPLRERLAHSLADKVNEKNRDSKKKARENAKKQLAITSPMSTRLFDSFDTPSPSSCRSGRLKNRINTDSSLRSSYTPKTPLLSPKLPSKSRNTPLRSPSITPTRSYNTDFSLTDNLLNLNIPKRPKAADFFS